MQEPETDALQFADAEVPTVIDEAPEAETEVATELVVTTDAEVDPAELAAAGVCAAETAATDADPEDVTGTSA